MNQINEKEQKKHEWQHKKDSKKYKKYLEKRYTSMRETHFKRLDELNKKPIKKEE